MFLVTGKDPDILVNLAQPAINVAVKWGEDNGLRFSPTKPQVILFHRKNKLVVKENLYINWTKLSFSDEVSYLGLTLNKNLNWNSIIVKKVNECKGKLCSLRSALGLKWGPSPKMVLWAFESLAVPSLTYGSLVWSHLELNKITLDKLRQLNRLAACLTSPVKKSTHSEEVVLGLKPLDLVAMESGMVDSICWKPRIRWDGIGFLGISGHVWTWNKLRMGLGLGNAPPEKTGLRHFNWDPPCVDNFVFDKDILVCAVYTEHLDHSIRFMSLFEGCGLMG